MNVVVNVERLPIEIHEAVIARMRSMGGIRDVPVKEVNKYYRFRGVGTSITHSDDFKEDAPYFTQLACRDEAISVNEFFLITHTDEEEPTVTIEISQATYESLKDSLEGAKVLKSHT